MKSIIFLAIFLYSSASSAKLYQVGPTRTYTAPSKVMNLVADGDTVEIDAGLYSGDVGSWHANNLVILCTSGMAHLDAAGLSAGGKAIWVITGKNTYIENIEFSGCSVADKNGAGIRQEGDNLELRHCYFHDNEDGILTGASATSDILFEACEFARNGFGDGYSHNMYIGNIRTFTMRFCYSHHAKIGHCVKSRAMNNFIEYNRIMDEDTGSASYQINLPNGGFSIVLGNTMMKGPNAQNNVLIDYGSEGYSNLNNNLYVVNNTLVSEKRNSIFIRVAKGAFSAFAANNIFCGSGSLISGEIDTTQENIYSLYKKDFSFADSSTFDYHPLKILPLSVNQPLVNGQPLLNVSWEYVQGTDSIIRQYHKFPTVGAFEPILNHVSEESLSLNYSNFPNPFSEKTTIDLTGIEDGSSVTINIFNQLGEKNLAKILIIENSQIIFERGNLAAGIYYYEIVNSKGVKIATGKFIVV